MAAREAPAVTTGMQKMTVKILRNTSVLRSVSARITGPSWPIRFFILFLLFLQQTQVIRIERLHRSRHSLSPNCNVILYQPLTAPSTMPFMICFWPIRKMTTMGMIASSAAVRIRSHCLT